MTATTAAPTVLHERYELGPLLGRGGMSDVYRAHDRHSGCDVAVKVFRPGLEVADAGPRRSREAQLAQSLDHPGLVRVLDAEHAEGAGPDGPAYLVVELVDGETLGSLLRRGPLPEREVLRLGVVLCETLAHIHSRGVVHRDVKPANVLMAPDGSPRLTDFGVARMIDGTRVTVEGFTVGTPNYLSPEQVTGAAVGFPADVYSLGLVLIEALTGELVYPGHGVEAAITRLHRDPVLPRDCRPDLAALLSAMTARDPRRRPSAARARHRFERLLAAGPAGMRARFARTAVATPRRRAAAGLGLIGSLAAATVGGVLLLTSQTAPGDSAPVHGQHQAPVAAAPSPPHSSAPAAHPGRSVPRGHRQPVIPAAARLDGAALRAAMPAPPRPKPAKPPKRHHEHGKPHGHGHPHDH